MDEQQFNQGSTDYSGTAARMKEEVAAKATDAKEKLAEFGRKAVDKIDAQREPAASKLDGTASSLHEQGERVASAAHKTADKLQATADYLRQNDLKAMADDVGDLVKRYPAQALGAAVAIGFLVGRAIRSRD